MCTGYGGLDDAVLEVFGGELIWHADPDPGASAILARNYPSVPNLGDITALDWHDVLEKYGRPDIACMGFPCQDVSVAGLQAGLLADNRSGLWNYCAQAIDILRPSLVVIENVPGLLSTTADRGLGPDASDLDPATGARLVLRALGAVLGDLAGLGFDAEWTSMAASDIGACHKRKRVFVLAWPADAPSPGLEARGQGRAARSLAGAAHAEGDGWNEGRPEPAGQQGRSHAAVGGRAAAADAQDVRLERGGATR
jgi:DNA (cytosine-5)-methyltransferase 1